MGEHVIGSLADAVKTVTVSRKRALHVLGAALAVAIPTRLPHAAEARRRRRPPAPEAFAVVRITNSSFSSSQLLWQITVLGDYFHPASSVSDVISAPFGFPAKLLPNELRAQLIRSVQQRVSEELAAQDEVADPARIAVSLF